MCTERSVRCRDCGAASETVKVRYGRPRCKECGDRVWRDVLWPWCQRRAKEREREEEQATEGETDR